MYLIKLFSQKKNLIKIILKKVCDKKKFHTFAVPKLNNLGKNTFFFFVHQQKLPM